MVRATRDLLIKLTPCRTWIWRLLFIEKESVARCMLPERNHNWTKLQWQSSCFFTWKHLSVFHNKAPFTRKFLFLHFGRVDVDALQIAGQEVWRGLCFVQLWWSSPSWADQWTLKVVSKNLHNTVFLKTWFKLKHACVSIKYILHGCVVMKSIGSNKSLAWARCKCRICRKSSF